MSPRSIWTSLLAALAPLVAACAAAPPVHFPQEERVWTVPLEDPLRAGELLVPVEIQGRGPFLFVLAPDAASSMIDRALAEELDLYTPPSSWALFRDSRDRLVHRRPYELLRASTGDLRINNFVAYGVPAGSLRASGRPVHGILGSNVLTSTVALDIDRDRGVVRMAITGHAEPPPDAVLIEGRAHFGRGGPHRELVISASLAGKEVDLAVDLAARSTAVRPDALRRAARFVSSETHEWVDDVGTRRRVSWRASAPLALEGGIRVPGPLLPFEDHRVRRFWDFDGVLGQDLLSRFRVLYHPDQRTLWLAPREDSLVQAVRARVGRWSELAGCPHLGCATVRVEGGVAVEVRLDREAPPALDVVLQAVDGAGGPIESAPLLRVAASESPRIDLRGIAGWAGAAAARVVDASPISRGCDDRCYEVYPLQPPASGRAAPGAVARFSEDQELRSPKTGQ